MPTCALGKSGQDGAMGASITSENMKSKPVANLVGPEGPFSTDEEVVGPVAKTSPMS